MYSKRLLNKVSGSGRREREGKTGKEAGTEEELEGREGKKKKRGGRSEGIAGQREETGNGRILLFPL